MSGVVNTDLVYGLTSGVKTIFMQAMAQMTPLWPELATLVQSTKATESYAWLNSVPAMRAFEGERAPRGLNEQGFTITNLEYEGTIEVDLKTLRDDQMGGLTLRIRDLAKAASVKVDKLISDLLNNAHTGLCYDGQAMADTDHADPKAEYTTSQVNYVSGGTTALSSPSIKTGIAAMAGFKDDRGELQPASPNLLVVPPALEWTARELVETKYVGGSGNIATTNPLANRLKVVVLPYLTSTTAWFLLDTNWAVKPLIWQLNQGPLVTQLMPSGEQETYPSFMRRVGYFGVYLYGGAGYGNWRQLYMAAGA